MSSNDDDKTVFGQRLPPQPKRPEQGQGQGQPAPSSHPQQGTDGERTVFGMRLPPRSPHPGQPSQPPAAPAHPQGRAPAQPPAAALRPGTSDDTWFGGRVPPQPHAAPPQQQPQQYPPQQPQYPQQPQQPQHPHYPQNPPAYPQQQPGYPPQQPATRGDWTAYPGQPPAQGQPAPQPYPPQYPPQRPPEPQPQQPYAGQYAQPQGWSSQVSADDAQFPTRQRPAAQAPVAVPQIAFSDALRGSELEIGTSSNPIIAAASDLLILLARLRTGMVEMQAIPLRDHVIGEIQGFVHKAQGAGISPEDIEVARYALAATSDDIVQTIPGADPNYWQQYSMASHLLNDRAAGIGFFARLDQVIALASQRRHVLELMLTCLAIGFEGKYRTEPNGAVALMRLRNEVYQRFRAVAPRPPEDISPRWTPMVLRGRKMGAGIPIWVVGSVASGMVVALFSTLAWVLSTEANAAQSQVVALHQGAAAVAIEAGSGIPERSAVPYAAPEPAQLDRLRERLAAEIDAGRVNVETKGDFIAIRVGDYLRFRSGSADLDSEFVELGKVIAASVEPEPGEIIVEGHSDNIPLKGSGRYKSNEALSEARAGTVRDILAQFLSDPARLSVVGVGPNDPIDTANTPEARARNRRVEILIWQEQKL